MKKAKLLALNTLIVTASSLIVSAISMVFNVYLANKIGAEQMGVFQLMMSVYMFAITLAVSGIGLASTRLVAEEQAMAGPAGNVRARQALKKCVSYALCLGSLAMALLLLGAPMIGNVWLHEPEVILPLRILAVSLPFLALSATLSGYFTAMRGATRLATAQLFEQTIHCVVTIYLLNLLLPKGMQWACLSIALGGALGESLSFAYRLILYFLWRKKTSGDFLKTPGNADPDHLRRRMLAIALPVAVSSYLRSALSTLKQMITPIYLQKSGMTKDAALAGYGAIRGMVMPVVMFPASLLYAFTSFLVPEIARFHAAKNHRRVREVMPRVFKMASLYSVGVCGILFYFATPLGLALYHSASAAGYIRILALLVPVMYFDTVVDGLLNGLNQQVSVVWINIIDTLSTILLTFFFLPRYGMEGYIIVIFISETLNTTLSVACLLRVAACRVNFMDWMLRPVVAVAAAVLFARFLPLPLIPGVAVSAVVYFGLLYGLGALTQQELRL